MKQATHIGNAIHHLYKCLQCISQRLDISSNTGERRTAFLWKSSCTIDVPGDSSQGTTRVEAADVSLNIAHEIIVQIQFDFNVVSDRSPLIIYQLNPRIR